MSAPKKSKSRSLLFILIGAVLLLVAFAVYKQKQKPKGEEVETYKLTKRTIKETVTASGKIFPEKEVKISSDVSGEIVQLLVEEGDSVVTGQLLAKVNPDAYMSAVERGQAGLNNAKAQLSISLSQVESSRAQQEQISAQLANTRKIHERNKQLKSQGVISQADFEASASNLEMQEANYRAAQASMRSAEQSAKAAEYNVKGSQASLKELQTSLQRTSIFAPTSGIISKLNVEEGERVVGTIQMAGTEMMRIANLTSYEVQVEVTENDILKVALNDEVEIEVDAYLDRTFKGKVSEIANSAANSAATGNSLTSEQVTNFVVKVRIDPDSYAELLKSGNKFPFRPGMSASVGITTEIASDALAVPIQAVTSREDKQSPDDKEGPKVVVTVTEGEDNEKSKATRKLATMDEIVFQLKGDTVAQVKVTTGIQDDEYIMISSGLNEGDEVVSGPYRTVSRTLKSGMTVHKKEEKKNVKVKAEK